MIKEFKDFIARGNVLDMAVGIIIGSAFGGIIKSLVADVLMPPVGLLLGGVDFSNLFIILKQGAIIGPFDTLSTAQEAGAVTINYGLFLNAVINFLIVSFAIFLLIRSINNIKKKEEALPVEITTKDCPYCFTTIQIKAARCPNCTSEL